MYERRCAVCGRAHKSGIRILLRPVCPQCEKRALFWSAQDARYPYLVAQFRRALK